MQRRGARCKEKEKDREAGGEGEGKVEFLDGNSWNFYEMFLHCIIFAMLR